MPEIGSTVYLKSFYFVYGSFTHKTIFNKHKTHATLFGSFDCLAFAMETKTTAGKTGRKQTIFFLLLLIARRCEKQQTDNEKRNVKTMFRWEGIQFAFRMIFQKLSFYAMCVALFYFVPFWFALLLCSFFSVKTLNTVCKCMSGLLFNWYSPDPLCQNVFCCLLCWLILFGLKRNQRTT